jgi:hypothetical protein
LRPKATGPSLTCSRKAKTTIVAIMFLTSLQKKSNVSLVMRVNSTNVQDEGLRIGGIGRQMNSKVKVSQTRRVSRINVVINLAYSQSVPDRPLLSSIYRWSGLKEPVESDTYYNIDIRHGLVLRL